MAISEKAIKFLGDSLNKGRPVPGQSLTNSPQEPYNWERPPEFTSPREAMYKIFDSLLEEEALLNTLSALDNGAGVIDIASVVLYAGFIEGKWSPDLMLLLMEPTMYMIIALAQKADIDFNLDAGDDEQPEEMSPDTQLSEINKGVKSLRELQQKAAGQVSPMSVPKEVKERIEETEIPQSLLSKVSKNSPKNLLGKEE
jgi:hypothetical protein|tara:strand:+ start:237 stop:833 length:597 start_codon:yes stop_codon:yes gene_type:complete